MVDLLPSSTPWAYALEREVSSGGGKEEGWRER
jgi:hypothetical protein